MPSPSGIYVGKSALELDALDVIADDRIANGDRVSMSGGGKSGSKQFSMSAEQMKIEIAFARNPLPNRRAEQIIRRHGQCNCY